MLDKLSVKKGYLLIAGALILLLLSYQFAFKHTLEAWQTHHQLQSKLTQSTDPGYQPGYPERKSANIDKIIGLYKADTSEFRSNIINTISSIAEKENVKLSEVPIQDISYYTDHFIVEKLGFEGDYFALVKLANELQSTNGIGIIRSVAWKAVKITTSNKVEAKKMKLEVWMEFTNK